MWSLRRIAASIISTVVAIVIVIVSIGISETIVGEIWSVVALIRLGPYSALPEAPLAMKSSVTDMAVTLLAVAGGLFVLNVVPDFISLWETRLVLGWAQGRSPIFLVFLVGLDIAFTSLIFWIVPALVLILVFDFEPRIEYLVADLRQYHSRRMLLPFFLTTFVTSALWLLFLGTFSAVRLIGIIRPAFLRTVEALSRSRRRTIALSSLANCTVLVVGSLLIAAAKLLSLDMIPAAATSWDLAEEIVVDRNYRGDFRSNSHYWLRFEPGEGEFYTAEARIYGIMADTEIVVYDSDNCWYDDDSGARSYGSIVHFRPIGETVYIRVGSYSMVPGPASDFTIEVRNRAGPTDEALPLDVCDLYKR